MTPCWLIIEFQTLSKLEIPVNSITPKTRVAIAQYVRVSSIVKIHSIYM